MILSSEKTITSYNQSGVWGNVTLDALFRRAAQNNPNRIALVDAPDRQDWTGGAPRSLTYAQAETEIRRIAGFFNTVGLEPDDIIAIQSPNTVDTVLCILAALRAGLIVSSFPLHWRHSEILPCLSDIGAKALITADRVETRMLGEDALNTAADYFSLKFVFGLGKQLPDGLIDMAPMIAESPEAFPEPRISRQGHAANHIATLTWVHTPAGPKPIPRSHNHWVAAGLMPFLETRLPSAAKLVIPYILSGLTGLGAGLVPWLLSEGTLHLHHPLALHSLIDHARWIEADYIVVPGSIAPNVDSSLASWGTKVIAAWNVAAMTPLEYKPEGEFYDLHIAEEYGMVAKLRGQSTLPNSFRMGSISAPSASPHAPTLLEISAAEQDLPENIHASFKGAMVPDVAWPDKKPAFTFSESGELQTNIPLDICEENDAIIYGFKRPESYAPGMTDLPRLDDIFTGFPGVKEAAAFLVEDEIVGHRLMVAVVAKDSRMVEVDDFYAYLDAARVSLAILPHKIIALKRLPKDIRGQIDREQLAIRVQPALKGAVA
ncbi:class I adenylate-forming enzyme family protein [Polycladidibacter stylochi]|uniref:class I adenylate-forming enzyme family protein n=1 Tax=Polycladidibacter stylochi TaxID=1807766 RepID=UPI00082FE02A|nr:class I adenylate-forming enzyme family protein [Pseudovibrio stylochi]